MTADVMLFGFTVLPEILAVEAAAKPLGVEVRVVAPGDCGLSIGELADGKSAAGNTAPTPAATGKMLVFCGLRDEQLDRLLPALRSAGVGGHRAVLTRHNRAWTPGRLLAELDREQAAMRIRS